MRISARVVDEISDLRELRVAGSIEFCLRGDAAVGGLRFICPCGCASEGFLPLRGGGHSHEWDWDGDMDTPTLTPSVQRVGGCQWHGWLRAGFWEAG